MLLGAQVFWRKISRSFLLTFPLKSTWKCTYLKCCQCHAGMLKADMVLQKRHPEESIAFMSPLNYSARRISNAVFAFLVFWSPLLPFRISRYWPLFLLLLQKARITQQNPGKLSPAEAYLHGGGSTLDSYLVLNSSLCPVLGTDLLTPIRVSGFTLKIMNDFGCSWGLIQLRGSNSV